MSSLKLFFKPVSRVLTSFVSPSGQTLGRAVNNISELGIVTEIVNTGLERSSPFLFSCRLSSTFYQKNVPMPVPVSFGFPNRQVLDKTMNKTRKLCVCRNTVYPGSQGFSRQFSSTACRRNVSHSSVFMPFATPNGQALGKAIISASRLCVNRQSVFTGFQTPSLVKLLCRFSSTSTPSQRNVQGLIAKRPVKKKVPLLKAKEKGSLYEVAAYATAEEYNLEELQIALEEQGLYGVITLPKDAENALYVRAKYKVDETLREIYFFREGCTVFWNMSDNEKSEVLKFLEKFSDNLYDDALLEQEIERMDFVHTDNSPGLVAGTIHVQESGQGEEIEDGIDQTILDKYAFSNALSLSTKLGIWEASLDNFVDSIEPVLQDMTLGKRIQMSRSEILRKTGELFILRHSINLSSDLLNPPDFYWDREHLEKLYQQTFVCLNINKRTKVMNEKLNHCCEMTDLLTSNLSDTHHLRLEWMIVILIVIEVIFEVIHYAEKYSLKQQVLSQELSEKPRS